MSATEQLEELINSANAGAIEDVGEQRGQFAKSLAALRESIPDLEFHLDDVREHGDMVAFRYTARGHGGRATWSGTGVGRGGDEGLSLVKYSEDHLGRLFAQRRFDELFTDPQDNVTGKWEGEVFGVPFVMDLTQDPPSPKVTGTISAAGFTFPVSGTNTPPNVEVSGKTDNGVVTFKGQWVSDNEICGKLTGAGFDNKVCGKRA